MFDSTCTYTYRLQAPWGGVGLFSHSPLGACKGLSSYPDPEHHPKDKAGGFHACPAHNIQGAISHTTLMCYYGCSCPRILKTTELYVDTRVLQDASHSERERASTMHLMICVDLFWLCATNSGADHIYIHIYVHENNHWHLTKDSTKAGCISICNRVWQERCTKHSDDGLCDTGCCCINTIKPLTVKSVCDRRGWPTVGMSACSPNQMTHLHL